MAPAPRAYTPEHLAEKILSARQTLEGERRVVTALFADAVGFTPLTERIGEEEVYRLMQGCVQRMMDAVHKYEGTVTSFTGDGVMALFGAPIAHEDSARRAVAAALEMQQSLEEYASDVHREHPIDCRFRVGLNTGPVVVGKISDDLNMDFTALGDTVNLAARMESVADPGGVYMTENTYRQVSDYFECEPLGAISVKGKAAPVITYRAISEKTAVRTRLQAAAERGLSPFVGRNEELSMLLTYLEKAKRGSGQVVFMSGDPGLGKSRLLLEFRLEVGGDVRWLEGHCLAYGAKMPYTPIVELVKRAVGIEDGDTEEVILGRIEEATTGWDAEARATLPYLRYLLSVDPGDPAVLEMDPLARRAGILDSLRALFVEGTKAGPVVIVIEDLHWVDENSADAVRALIDVVATTPVLVVLTFRPGYTHGLGDRSYFSRIALSHLRPEDSAEIMSRLLETADLPAELAGMITRKTEGNPFFVEEVTRSLVEAGVLAVSDGAFRMQRSVDEIRVPDTVQEVILSRIDRLESEAREAIQLASVIGREFALRLLTRISEVQDKLDGALGDLKTLELIYEKAYFPELSYMFKHALTQDVAYSTLLAERRKSLHRTVAHAIEDLYRDRLAEHYEMLAHHYLEGEQWDKALEYLDLAGDKARDAFANADALEYYGQAIEVGERLGEFGRIPALAEKRGLVNYIIGKADAAIVDFDKMGEACRLSGNRSEEGRALAWRGAMQVWTHEIDKSEVSLREALAIGDEGYAEVKAVASFWLGAGLMIFGRVDEAKPYLDEGSRTVPELGDPLSHGWCVAMQGIGENWEGQYDKSLEILNRRREVLEQAIASDLLGRWVEALALGGKGEYEAALEKAKGAIALCDRVGEQLIRARLLNTVGWVLGELQNHDEAVEWNLHSEQSALELGLPDPEIESNARLNIGDSYTSMGRLDEAEWYFKMVEEVIRNPQPADHFALWLYSQHFFHSYGSLLLVRGEPEKALSLADECIQLAQSTNRAKNVIKGRRLRGQAFLALGNLEEAEAELEVALALAREVGNPPQLWKTHVAIAELRSAQGRPDDSRWAYNDALAVVDGVAAALTDDGLRETFLGCAHIRDLREAANAQP